MLQENPTLIAAEQDGEEMMSQVCATTLCISLSSRQEQDHDLKLIRDYLLKNELPSDERKAREMYYRSQNLKWLMECYTI